MTNAELIKAIRCYLNCQCCEHDLCDYILEDGYCNIDKILSDAADALEAADEKTADCVAAIDALDDSNDAYIKENERLKKRIEELEKQLPKEGEWIWDIDGMDWGIGSWRCKNCHARPNTYWQCDSTINPLTFAGSSYCPNCGAKMKGANDERTRKAKICSELSVLRKSEND